MIEVTKTGDAFCDFCILLMECLSRETGLSYGLINVLLFVILGPLSTTAFFASSMIFALTKPDRIRNIVAWTLFAIGSVCVLIVIAMIIYGFLSMPL